jgi:hypothetical protein
MAAQHLYYDVQGTNFISKEDALRIVHDELSKGNLHVMTDRMIEYSFPPHEEAEVMKIRIKVNRPMSAVEGQTKTLYYYRRSREYIIEDQVQMMMVEALKEGNLNLMTDRTHEYDLAPGMGCLRETKIVKISVIVE